MKSQLTLDLLSRTLVLLLLGLFSTNVLSAAPTFLQDPITGNIQEYRGTVESASTGDELSSVHIAVAGTNISTITNSEGEFFLKVPYEHSDASVNVSHLGYRTKVLPAKFFKEGPVKIQLIESAEVLAEVNIFNLDDPRKVIWEMLKRKRDNYALNPTEMTAFYRESIKRGRRNVSLSEAVVKIHKKPYTTFSRDEISLVKARKSADYDRLDTLAMKLRGGPFNPLVLDIMKNPDYMFYQEDLGNYQFTFEAPTRINDRYLYVIGFEDSNKNIPWYYGTLYIDAESLALVKADFQMNVENRDVASDMFVKKKPGGTRVYPVNVVYQAEYRQQDGKWFFGYGQTEIEMVVNWKRKLFNSRYTINSELAVTNWTPEQSIVNANEKFLKPNVVMSDDVAGFTDINFWGENNIIEPDKSIENAIEKIQKNIRD